MQQPSSSIYRLETTVGELPHSAQSFDIATKGSEIAGFFETNPEAPGVIITSGAELIVMLSQTEFLRAVGRQFGSELFHRRPIQATLEYLQCKPPLVLSADCLIHDAVTRCLEREGNEMFEPFLVKNLQKHLFHVVDFRNLMFASSEVFALRNQRLSEEMQQRKLLEQKLLRAQRMESIGLLTGGIAHNLNNTLAPVMMAADMLNTDLSPESRKEFISTIEKSAQRAADIIQQLLVFARGLDGKPVTFQPQTLLGDVIKFVASTFPKAIALQTHIPNTLWNITGDQTQIHQILLNLCMNAKDAMPEGGAITLSARNCQVDENFDGLTTDAQPGKFLRLDVADTGTGIPKEIIEKIFDPFFTTKDVGKGTGLGLSTVLGIARSHGGFITVSSEMGKGTTFSVFLPASQDAENAESPQPKVKQPQGIGEVILVVDDEEPIRHLVKIILTKNGYTVVTAANGSEALAAYECDGKKINLVLTDVSMPLMDGVSLARELKAANPAVKIVAASGHSEKARRNELFDLGVQGFLTKPYHVDELLKSVHEGIYALAS